MTTDVAAARDLIRRALTQSSKEETGIDTDDARKYLGPFFGMTTFAILTIVVRLVAMITSACRLKAAARTVVASGLIPELAKYRVRDYYRRQIESLVWNLCAIACAVLATVFQYDLLIPVAYLSDSQRISLSFLILSILSFGSFTLVGFSIVDKEMNKRNFDEVRPSTDSTGRVMEHTEAYTRYELRGEAFIGREWASQLFRFISIVLIVVNAIDLLIYSLRRSHTWFMSDSVVQWSINIFSTAFLMWGWMNVNIGYCRVKGMFERRRSFAVWLMSISFSAFQVLVVAMMFLSTLQLHWSPERTYDDFINRFAKDRFVNQADAWWFVYGFTVDFYLMVEGILQMLGFFDTDQTGSYYSNGMIVDTDVEPVRLMVSSPQEANVKEGVIPSPSATEPRKTLAVIREEEAMTQAIDKLNDSLKVGTLPDLPRPVNSMPPIVIPPPPQPSPPTHG